MVSYTLVVEYSQTNNLAVSLFEVKRGLASPEACWDYYINWIKTAQAVSIYYIEFIRQTERPNDNARIDA